MIPEYARYHRYIKGQLQVSVDGENWMVASNWFGGELLCKHPTHNTSIDYELKRQRNSPIDIIMYSGLKPEFVIVNRHCSYCGSISKLDRCNSCVAPA